MLTEPLPAPTSHTMLDGAMSICASAIARTSAGVSKPCLRLRLQERLVRIAEQPPPDRFARPIRRVRVADQDHHVERVELLGRDLAERAAGHAFVAGAKVLAHVRREVVDLPRQRAPWPRRPGRIRRS